MGVVEVSIIIRILILFALSVFSITSSFAVNFSVINQVVLTAQQGGGNWLNYNNGVGNGLYSGCVYSGTISPTYYTAYTGESGEIAIADGQTNSFSIAPCPGLETIYYYVYNQQNTASYAYVEVNAYTSTVNKIYSRGVYPNININKNVLTVGL